MALIYLAIPYSVWEWEKSFDVANQVAAQLMLEGYSVFSPISHSHPIQANLPTQTHTHDFWMNQDLPILKCCEEIVFVRISSYKGKKVKGDELLQKSTGCKEELIYAHLNNVKVRFINYNS